MAEEYQISDEDFGLEEKPKKSLKETVEEIYGKSFSKEEWDKAMEIVSRIAVANQKAQFGDGVGSDFQSEVLKKRLENCKTLEDKRKILVEAGFIRDNRTQSQRISERKWGKTPVPFTTTQKRMYVKSKPDFDTPSLSSEELEAKTKERAEKIKEENKW